MEKSKEFDYVIVGAGSAGCVLANRLTSRPEIRVLLLEAGGRDNDIHIQMPGSALKLLPSRRHNWYSLPNRRRMLGTAVYIGRGAKFLADLLRLTCCYTFAGMSPITMPGLRQAIPVGHSMMCYLTLKGPKEESPA